MSNKLVVLPERSSPLGDAIEGITNIVGLGARRYEAYKEAEKKRIARNYLQEALANVPPETNSEAFTRHLVQSLPKDAGVLEAALTDPAYLKYIEQRQRGEHEQGILQRAMLAAQGKQQDTTPVSIQNFPQASQDYQDMSPTERSPMERSPMERSPLEAGMPSTSQERQPTSRIPQVSPQDIEADPDLVTELADIAARKADKSLNQSSLSRSTKEGLVKLDKGASIKAFGGLGDRIYEQELGKTNLQAIQQLAQSTDFGVAGKGKMGEFIRRAAFASDDPGLIASTVRSWWNATATEKQQQSQKLMEQLFNNIRSFFGGGARILKSELDIFKRTIPQLSNSPVGMQLLAKQLEEANELSMLANKYKQAINVENPLLSPSAVDKIVADSMVDRRAAFRQSIADLADVAEATRRYPDQVIVYTPEWSQKLQEENRPADMERGQPVGRITQITKEQYQAWKKANPGIAEQFGISFFGKGIAD